MNGDQYSISQVLGDLSRAVSVMRKEATEQKAAVLKAVATSENNMTRLFSVQIDAVEEKVDDVQYRLSKAEDDIDALATKLRDIAEASRFNKWTIGGVIAAGALVLGLIGSAVLPHFMESVDHAIDPTSFDASERADSIVWASDLCIRAKAMLDDNTARPTVDCVNSKLNAAGVSGASRVEIDTANARGNK